MMPLRVAFVITGLSTGGAETMLAKLLARSSRRRISPAVISLMRCSGGPVETRIRQLGVPVHSLGMAAGRPSPGALFSLNRLLRTIAPAVISGWEVHGNVAACCASWLLGIPSVWNVRGSLDDPASEKMRTRAWIRALGLLSRHPQAIVYNSHRARRQHEAAGYCASSGVVIPNGFDCGVFRPDPAARSGVRRELNLAEDAFVIGMMARFHPVKDHPTLIDAAGRAARAGVPLHLLLAGTGCDAANRELSAQIARAGLAGRASLLGERSDAPRLTAALDLACLTSTAESFPNAVGEAMACGVPVAATGVGDTAALLDGWSWTVPPRRPDEMAAALVRWYEMGAGRRTALGAAARRRIQAQFDLGRVAEKFDHIHAQAAEVRLPREIQIADREVA